MASIRKEISLEAPVDHVWNAIRDAGAVHTRLTPGFVTDCRMDEEARVVTFANGFVARELIVDVDDKARRLAYSARTANLLHHNASFQVLDEGNGRCRVVWTADILPHSAAIVVNAMMDEGVAVMRKTLESHSQPAWKNRG